MTFSSAVSITGASSSFLIVNNSTLRKGDAASLSFTTKIQANVYNKESTLTAEGTNLALSLGPGECSLVEITNYR
jgi:predicted metal-binding protein